MDKNYLVTKSNYFIMNSSYDLSLEEQKLILTLASMVQPNDEEFKPYIFKISDFMKLLNVQNQSKYTEIPKITKELMKKVFEIEEGNKIIQTAWLSGAIYEKGTGYVTLKFNPDLKPYMLKLNNMFTRYKLVNILSMKSKYSPRIYEILKCNQFKEQGYVKIEVTELRKLLKAEKIYPRYFDFKKKIIEQTQKELNKVSDISFNFEEIKTGRKVTSIKFYIKNNSTKVNAQVESLSKRTPLEEIEKGMKDVKIMLENKVSDNESLSIYGSAEGDIDIIKKAYVYCKNKKTDNFVGYIIKIIKSIKDGTFNEPHKTGGEISTTNSFNNFKGRDYTTSYYNLMERCLNGTATDEERKIFDEMKEKG